MSEKDKSGWHHSPMHVFVPSSTYMVTGGTYKKQPFFQGERRLSFLLEQLFLCAKRYTWQLQAWCILPNHYHFISMAPAEVARLSDFVRDFHSRTALYVNELDGTPSRKVWFQYWDTCITFEKSYYARLNYVHNNAVKHQIANVATEYPFCSARWFEQNVESSFYRMASSFKYDKLNVVDDF